MDGEDNLPAPPVSSSSNLIRSINHDSSSSSSSSSSSFSAFSKSSEPDFLRNVQAAFKRHRSHGMMQSNNLLPRRCLPPQRETSKSSIEVASLRQGPEVNNSSTNTNETASVIVEAHEDASLTPPSISGTMTNTYDEKYNSSEAQRNEDQPAPNCKDIRVDALSHGDLKHVPMVEGSKKVQFSLASSAISPEMEWEAVSQAERSNIMINESKHQNPLASEADGGLRVDGGSSSLAVRMSALQNQLHHLRNFLHTDASHPMTQSSVVGSSCPTTTSVHATSAPMLNSTTHGSCPQQDSVTVRSSADANLNTHNVAVGDGVHQSCPSSMLSSGSIADRAVSGAQASSSARDVQVTFKEIQQGTLPSESQVSKDPYPCHAPSVKEKEHVADTSSVQPPCPSPNKPSSDVKSEPAKSEKQEKVASRKKSYAPDLFFRVNGKLYQRLGKIGSGGSSEVHKVISSDCTIYALKKIKLKGRDYATAYGFCQEILYLKKLKGKSNIIQLVDYEVTDKALLHEVMNGSTNNKDNRVKDDGYIYMVLEYGEIDLAHMLSQKWKENEGSDSIIDENWLRFYWQQILQAVNTIHEERIVHSDLKPANFLLVKGSLKLIDFGIAKAIMSDTTNIQRDAQVGTLSYMSPEAFLCNENDANGNIIKCGRPSDIWSLGCILYQMVYGRTPFSEYKTFWAKFKVITDPNHEITYGPLSNPWLLDLMKKCLAWDRNQRWRIPQLLKHPFLVPPVPHQLSPPSQDQNCKAIQLIAESCANDQEASTLCSELQQLLGDPSPASREQQCKLLSQISNICQQLQEHIEQNR